jgi:hypothetical protein
MEQTISHLMLYEERLTIPLDALGITCVKYTIVGKWWNDKYFNLIVLFYMNYPGSNTYRLKKIVVDTERAHSWESSECILDRFLIKGSNLDLLLWKAFKENIELPCELEVPLNTCDIIGSILSTLDINSWYFLSSFQRLSLESGDVIKISSEIEWVNGQGTLTTVSPINLTLNHNHSTDGTMQITYKGKLVCIPQQLLYKNYNLTSATLNKYKPFECKVIDAYGTNEILNIIYLSWNDSTYYLDIVELYIAGANKGLISFHQNAQPMLDRFLSYKGASFKLLRFLIKELKTPCLIQVPVEMEESFLNLIDVLGREIKKIDSKTDFRNEKESYRFFIATKGSAITYKLLPMESNTVIQMYQMDNI